MSEVLLVGRPNDVVEVRTHIRGVIRAGVTTSAAGPLKLDSVFLIGECVYLTKLAIILDYAK